MIILNDGENRFRIQFHYEERPWRRWQSYLDMLAAKGVPRPTEFGCGVPDERVTICAFERDVSGTWIRMVWASSVCSPLEEEYDKEFGRRLALRRCYERAVKDNHISRETGGKLLKHYFDLQARNRRLAMARRRGTTETRSTIGARIGRFIDRLLGHPWPATVA